MSNDDHKVGSIREHSKLPDAAKARGLLEKLAADFLPLLRKRQWTVPVLKEMCSCSGAPKRNGPGVLGMNMGGGNGSRCVWIAVRLRRRCGDGADGHAEFFDYEQQICDTFCHELAHIVHGNHSAKFYKLWDELREEYVQLLKLGPAAGAPAFGGAGAASSGHSHNPSSEAEGRRKGLEAAQARAQKQRLMWGGGRAIGGARAAKGLAPHEAAKRAAVRRARDDAWCPCAAAAAAAQAGAPPGAGWAAGAGAAAAAAATPAAAAATAAAPARAAPSAAPAAAPLAHAAAPAAQAAPLPAVKPPARRAAAAAAAAAAVRPPAPKRARPAEGDVIDLCDDSPSPAKRPEPWSCGSCTLRNEPGAEVCGVCGAGRDDAELARRLASRPALSHAGDEAMARTLAGPPPTAGDEDMARKLAAEAAAPLESDDSYARRLAYDGDGQGLLAEELQYPRQYPRENGTVPAAAPAPAPAPAAGSGPVFDPFRPMIGNAQVAPGDVAPPVSRLAAPKPPPQPSPPFRRFPPGDGS